MRLLLLTLTLFGTLGPCVRAQTYTATLRTLDAATSQALGFVNLAVQGTTTGGTTDAGGTIELPVPAGRQTLLVSFVSYENQALTLDVRADFDLDIFLEPSAATLETVTVSSDDASARLDEPLMGVERLSIAEITALPVALGEVDVFRGLQLVSGVNSAGEASNGLSIRGGTIDQNLVLLDGAPIFTPTHLFGLFSVFTPDAIGSVDLYKANIPARFGGRVASVVDVRSRNPTADKFRMQGGIGLVSSRLSIETPLTKNKKLKVLAAGRASFNDFLLTAVDRLKNTRSRFVDGTVKLRYTTDNNNIFTVSSFYSTDFYELDLISSFSGITASSNQYDYSTFNVTGEWLKIFNDNTSIRTRLVTSDHQPSIIFPQNETDFEVRYDQRIRYRSANSALTHQAGSHRLTGGIEIVNYEISPGTLDPDDSPDIIPLSVPHEQALEAALFVEDEWKATDKFTLSAGLRAVQYAQLGPTEQRLYGPAGLLDERVTVANGERGQTYNSFEPRLGLAYELNALTSLKAAYARSYQYLQNIFNSTTPLPTSRWKVADNNIVPQSSELFSAGLYRTLGDGTYSTSLEGYYRSVNNLLEYRPGADFFLNPEVETDLLQGEGQTYGAEFSLRKTKGLVQGEVNYTYGRSFNRVAGGDIASTINGGDWYLGYFDQPHTFNLNLNMDDGRLHKLSLNLVVQSNRPYSVPNGFLRIDDIPVPIFLERNNARLPVYHRLDLSWTIHNAKMRKRRWVGDWTVTIYNALGRDNAFNIYYQPRSGAGNAEVFGSSPLGSYQVTIFGAPIFSLSYSFKFQ